MKLHANAKLSVKGRELLVDRVEAAGWSLTQASGGRVAHAIASAEGAASEHALRGHAERPAVGQPHCRER